MDNTLKTPAELLALLGEAVRALRVAQHWTQAQVAAKAGLSAKAVATLERGEGSSLETFVRVLQALKATQGIEGLAPRPQVSPLALLRSPKPPQRVRHRASDQRAS